MKKKPIINTILLAFLSCFYVYNTYAQQDTVLVKQHLLYNSLYNQSSNNDFNAYRYSLDLKETLKNYNLRIYNTQTLGNGSAVFSTDYLGKSFFKDYYKVYQNDLTKHLPKLPNLSLYNPKKIH